MVTPRRRRPRAPRPAVAQPPPSVVDSAEARVRAAGALPLAKLAPGLGRQEQSALVRALVARGLERYARGVRVPIAEQVAQRLEQAGTLPLGSARRALAGAPARADVDKAVQRLVRQKNGMLFATPEGLVLSRERTPLSAAEAAELEDALAQLGELLAARGGARGRARPHLAREDVLPMLTALAARLRVGEPAPPATSPRRALDDAPPAETPADETTHLIRSVLAELDGPAAPAPMAEPPRDEGRLDQWADELFTDEPEAR